MSTNIPKTDDEIFEDEVRRIARELWPSAEYGGAVIVHGRETDGVFVTEDCINIVEATTSREKKKAVQDGEKLKLLSKEYSKGGHDKAVRCFFITKYEPTGEQRTALKEISQNINALQYSQFQQKLINATSYLDSRENYAFGSARDPLTNDISPASGYVDMDLLELKSKEAWGLQRIKNSIVSGYRFCLLGDYGAGKSMTLREVYKLLRADFLKTNTVTFPVYINLRDHQGQSDPSEIILRHATMIGFKHSDHLIRAWRAGYVVLILDGFDEIGAQGWAGQWKKLRDLRYRAVEAVRRFYEQTPPRTGIICAGRAHFFDNDSERRHSLGIGDSAINLTLSDFSDEQVAKYLAKFALNTFFPAWLPRRPLLVGYLASKGLISAVVDSNEGALSWNDAPTGWNTLLDKIANREATIDAGIDGFSLRRVIERIATKARCTANGLGPISQQQLNEAFVEICGYPPNEAAMVLLQRLPGLGTKSGIEEARFFIDEDLADVCRVGDVLGFAADPFSYPCKPLENLECAIGEIGQQVLASSLLQREIGSGKLGAAFSILRLHDNLSGVMADIAISGIRLQLSMKESVFIRGVSIPSLDLADIGQDLTNYFFQDCFVSELELAGDGGRNYPRFVSTYVGRLIGRVSRADLPEGMFDSDCIIDAFDNAISTSDDILELDVPIGQRVLLTVLRKLYVQRGAGRRESALYRGLDAQARRVVPDVLQVLKSDRLVYPAKHGGNLVWYPVRSQTSRVYAMLNSPGASKDIVFTAAARFAS